MDSYTIQQLAAWSLTRQFFKTTLVPPVPPFREWDEGHERAYYLNPLTWAEAQRRVLTNRAESLTHEEKEET